MGTIVQLPVKLSLDDISHPVFADLDKRVKAEGSPIGPFLYERPVRYDGQDTDLVVLKYSGRAGQSTEKLGKIEWTYEGKALDKMLDGLEASMHNVLFEILRAYNPNNVAEEIDRRTAEDSAMSTVEWTRNAAPNSTYVRVTGIFCNDHARIDVVQNGNGVDIMDYWKPGIPTKLQKRGHGLRIMQGTVDEFLAFDRARYTSQIVMRAPKD